MNYPLTGHLQFGLGSMGSGMALNLQKHLQNEGHPPLRYSNRTLAKGALLCEAGAVHKEKFESVVQESDVIFTMVRCLTLLMLIFLHDAHIGRFQMTKY